jgi:hypothetical protein
VGEDLPPDVRTVLTQLFAEGREALAAGDREVALDAVTTAETVATNKLPEGPLRGRLLHGCGRVRALAGDGATADGPGEGDATGGATPGGSDEAAAAYLAAMERRVADGGDG